MAQKVSIVLVDDLDGSEASETVTFALDGTSYEIDLNDANAAALRESLASYVGVARKVGRSGGKTASKSAQSTGSGRDALSKADRDAVREWSRTKEAKAAGIEPLGERGRIPDAAVAAWRSR